MNEFDLLSTVNPFLAAVSPQSIDVIEDSSTTLEFVIAVDSDGHAWNADDINFRFSSSVDIDMESAVPFSVCDAMFPQTYCYTIGSVDRSQEGLYIVSASSECFNT